MKDINNKFKQKYISDLKIIQDIERVRKEPDFDINLGEEDNWSLQSI